MASHHSASPGADRRSPFGPIIVLFMAIARAASTLANFGHAIKDVPACKCEPDARVNVILKRIDDTDAALLDVIRAIDSADTNAALRHAIVCDRLKKKDNHDD